MQEENQEKVDSKKPREKCFQEGEHGQLQHVWLQNYATGEARTVHYHGNVW